MWALLTLFDSTIVRSNAEVNRAVRPSAASNAKVYSLAVTNASSADIVRDRGDEDVLGLRR